VKVGIKLFNKAGTVVAEKDLAPREVGNAGVVMFGDTYYGYAGLFGKANPERPYVKFVECDPPVSLDELL
jgi:hypothetical protein